MNKANRLKQRNWADAILLSKKGPEKLSEKLKNRIRRRILSCVSAVPINLTLLLLNTMNSNAPKAAQNALGRSIFFFLNTHAHVCMPIHAHKFSIEVKVSPPVGLPQGMEAAAHKFTTVKMRSHLQIHTSLRARKCPKQCTCPVWASITK